MQGEMVSSREEIPVQEKPSNPPHKMMKERPLIVEEENSMPFRKAIK